MPIQITMPRLSDTMQEGTLVKWRVKVGDKVKSGDLLADVETDKATMELQSFDDGTVALLAVEEGQAAPVGKLIIALAEAGESIEDAAKAVGGDAAQPAPSASASPSAPAATEEPAEDQGQDTSEAGRVRVSPLARKIAEDKNVDVSRLKGTGPGGRIIKRDILAAAEGGAAPASAPASAPAAAPIKPLIASPVAPAAAAPSTPLPKLEGKTVKLTNMRKTIARRLVESKTTVPHFTVTLAVDMDLLLGPRGAKKQLETQGIKLSVNDFVVRACALALAQHPECNASWAGDSIVQHGTVNIGVAVALPPEKGGGLVVPTLRNVQTMGLRAISAETRRLAEKSRTAGLTVEEMSDGTFTISNLGMFGVEHFEAIINPPQSAILAVGAALDKPVVRDGQIVVGKEMTLTLSGDHRVIDGAGAAQFLQTVKQMLENPAVLLV